MACNFSENSSWVSSSDANFSCMANPRDMLNPWRINEYFMAIVITYSITFIIGVTGNIFAMMGLVGDRKTRNATNSFLVSLSAADLLLLLVCVPLETLQYFVIRWDESGTVCKMAKYVEALSAIASVLNLTAVSLERFIVIVFPMRSRSLCTLSNCRRAVLAVWLISLILTAPVIASKGFHRNYGRSSRTFGCVFVVLNMAYVAWSTGGTKQEGSNPMVFTNGVDSVTIYYCSDRDEGGLLFSIYLAVVLLLAPALVMIVCYTYVIRELWISTQNMNLLTNNFRTNRTARNSYDRTHRCSLQSELTCEVSRGHGACLTPCHGPCSSNTQSSPCTSMQVNRTQRQTPRFSPHNASEQLNQFSAKKKPAQKNAKVLFGRSKTPEDARSTRKQVIKMLILVIVLFLGCWGPRIFMEVCIKLQWVSFTPTVYRTRIVLYLLPFIHSCVNPLIYTVMSKNFRRTMARRCCYHPERREHSQYNNSHCGNYQSNYTVHLVPQQTLSIDLEHTKNRLIGDRYRNERTNAEINEEDEHGIMTSIL